MDVWGARWKWRCALRLPQELFLPSLMELGRRTQKRLLEATLGLDAPVDPQPALLPAQALLGHNKTMQVLARKAQHRAVRRSAAPKTSSTFSTPGDPGLAAGLAGERVAT